MEWGRVGSDYHAASADSSPNNPPLVQRIWEALVPLLREAADLDLGRRTELETRLILGYYDRPDIREAVADRLAAMYGRRAPEDSAGCGPSPG